MCWRRNESVRETDDEEEEEEKKNRTFGALGARRKPERREKTNRDIFAVVGRRCYVTRGFRGKVIRTY